MGRRSRLDRRLVRRREAKAGAQQALLPPAAVRDSGRMYQRRELWWGSFVFADITIVVVVVRVGLCWVRLALGRGAEHK